MSLENSEDAPFFLNIFRFTVIIYHGTGFSRVLCLLSRTICGHSFVLCVFVRVMNRLMH